MRRLPRLCFIIPSLGLGGTETQLLRLVRGLSSPFEISIICTREGGTLYGDARRLGADVKILGGYGGWDFTLKGKIVHAFGAQRPDIVHTFLFGFDLVANRAARQRGVPVVISSRRELATWKKMRHVRVQKRANALVNAVVANSRAAAEFAIQQEKLAAGMVTVIPNGIDALALLQHGDVELIRRRYKIPRKVKVIGTVANFSPVKDYPLMLKIAREIEARRPDVHFLFVGVGPQRDAMEDRAESYGLREKVTVVTTIAEMADLYALMDVFVLCSKAEGLPNVIMEAMAAKRAIVAAAVGGIPELIDNGRTGHLVESRKPSDFADAIEKVLNDPEGRRAMGERAHDVIAEDYSVDAMVAAYNSFYMKLLQETSSKGP